MSGNASATQTSEDILKKIKSRGHWLINVRPVGYNPSRFKTLPRCQEAAEKTTVLLRGWDYPHSPKDGLIPKQDHVEGSVDWDTRKELWRLYQSGQFIHFLGLREDWFEQAEWFEPVHPEVKPGQILEPIFTVLTMTEVFEYLSRLASLEERIFNEGSEVRIILHGASGRRLDVLDPRRTPLLGEYRCAINEVHFATTLSEKQLLTENRKRAISATIEIMTRFRWVNPPIAVFEDVQQKLYDKRL